MTEPAPALDRSHRGRSLTGFYIALGVAAVLVGLGAWLWRPMQVLYLEREARKFQGEISYMPAGRCMSDGWGILCPAASSAHWVNGNDYEGFDLPIEKLARMGPVARPAVARLLKDPEVRLRGLAIVALGDAKPPWARDLMVEASRDSDDKVAAAAVWAMEKLSGLRLARSRSGVRLPEAEMEQCRQDFLRWWEVEGQTKYERDGQ